MRGRIRRERVSPLRKNTTDLAVQGDYAGASVRLFYGTVAEGLIRVSLRKSTANSLSPGKQGAACCAPTKNLHGSEFAKPVRSCWARVCGRSCGRDRRANHWQGRPTLEDLLPRPMWKQARAWRQ